MDRNNVHDSAMLDDSMDEACEWLARIDRGLSTGEEKSLQEWLSEKPDNPELLLKIARVWDKMETLNKLADIFPHKAPRPPVSFGFRLAKAFVVVISITVMGMMGAHYYNRLSHTAPHEKEYVFQTAIGEQSTVNLTDGSQLILNTNSLVEVEFSQDERKVYLRRGEIYVKVAHKKSQPFNVYTGNRIIKAVGTEFNIKITEDQRIEVIVTEGRVLVAVMDKSRLIPEQKSVMPGPDTTGPMPVSSGERILLGDSESIEDTRQVAPEEIEVKLSWRGGNLVFHGESLEEALGQIERYTQVEFIILDEDLKKLRIAGQFKAGDVDGLLKTLRQNFDISYQLVNNEKVILSGNQ